MRIEILKIDSHPAFPKIFQFVFDGNDEAAFAEAQTLPEQFKKKVIDILFSHESYIEKAAAILYLSNPSSNVVVGDSEHISLFVESVLRKTKAKIPVTFREVMNGKAVSQLTRSWGTVLTVLDTSGIGFSLTGDSHSYESFEPNVGFWDHSRTDGFIFGSIAGFLDNRVSEIAFTQHHNCDIRVADAESDTKQQHAAEAEAKTSASVIRKFATEAFLVNHKKEGVSFLCLTDILQTTIDAKVSVLKLTSPITQLESIGFGFGSVFTNNKANEFRPSQPVYNPTVDRIFVGKRSTFSLNHHDLASPGSSGMETPLAMFYENGSDNILLLEPSNRFPEKWAAIHARVARFRHPECSSGYLCFTYDGTSWKPIQLFDFLRVSELFNFGENISIASSLPSDSHIEQIRRRHPFVVSGNYGFRFFPDRLEVIDVVAKKVIRSLPCILSSNKREFAKTILGPRSMGELLHRIYTGETHVEDPEDYNEGCPHHYELDRERVVQITQDTRVRARVISTSGEIYLGEVEKDRSPDAFFAHGIECIKGLMEVRPHVYLRRDRMSYEDESGRSTICGRFTAEPRLPISDWTFMEEMFKLTPQEFSLWTVPQLVRKVSAYLTHDWGDERRVWTTKTPIFFRPQKDRIATRESEVKTRATKSDGRIVGSAAAAAAAAPPKPPAKGLDEVD